MITKLSHCTVFVTDQDRAKAFYTEKLGFEVRDDVRMGTFRWLTVGPKTQPDLNIVLMAIGSGPMMNEDQTKMLRTLVEAGVMSGGVIECDDIHRTYEELAAKGVKFDSPPKEQPYGIEAIMRDDTGNFFSMGQKR